MSEADTAMAQPGSEAYAGPVAGSAGRLLRQAREAQGLPIDSLAASIKVSVRKIELLEADRFDELPDATFTRALAQTVCRSLKIDAAQVLALLPAARGHRIEQVSEGLNAPFRDRSPRLDALAWDSLLKAAWAPVLLLGLAALLYYAPSGFVGTTVAAVRDTLASWKPSASSSDNSPTPSTPPTAAPSDAAVPTEAPAPQAALEPTVIAPVPAAASSVAASSAASAVASPAPPAAGPLQLRANAESWIEVKDARDRVLISRSLQPSETVTLDGVLPMRVKIGNAAVTEVRFRGELIDIVPMTSENIARVELK